MDGKVDVDPKIDNVHSFPMQANAMLRIGHCVVQKLSENGLITFTLNKNGDIDLNAVRCQKNNSEQFSLPFKMFCFGFAHFLSTLTVIVSHFTKLPVYANH